jgi:PIN domain nuclease of toxin-antitoxin system
MTLMPRLMTLKLLWHRAPFDRIIIATVKINGFEILSADIEFDAYPIVRLW